MIAWIKAGIRESAGRQNSYRQELSGQVKTRTIMKLPALLFLLAVPGFAHAATVISVTRSVSGYGSSAVCEISQGNNFESPGSGQTHTSIAAGVYNRSISGTGAVAGYGSAGQNTETGTEGLTITSISTTMSGGFGCLALAYPGGASAESSLDYTFEVDVPTTYRLFGSIMGGWWTGQDGLFRLSFGGISTGTLASLSASSTNPFGGNLLEPFDYTGVLAPGRYSFSLLIRLSDSESVDSSDLRVTNGGLSLTPVPVPEAGASVVLLAAAVTGFVLRRRQQDRPKS